MLLERLEEVRHVGLDAPRRQALGAAVTAQLDGEDRVAAGSQPLAQLGEDAAVLGDAVDADDAVGTQRRVRRMTRPVLPR